MPSSMRTHKLNIAFNSDMHRDLASDKKECDFLRSIYPELNGFSTEYYHKYLSLFNEIILQYQEKQEEFNQLAPYLTTQEVELLSRNGKQIEEIYHCAQLEHERYNPTITSKTPRREFVELEAWSDRKIDKIDKERDNKIDVLKKINTHIFKLAETRKAELAAAPDKIAQAAADSLTKVVDKIVNALEKKPHMETSEKKSAPLPALASASVRFHFANSSKATSSADNFLLVDGEKKPFGKF